MEIYLDDRDSRYCSAEGLRNFLLEKQVPKEVADLIFKEKVNGFQILVLTVDDLKEVTGTLQAKYIKRVVNGRMMS